MVKTVQSSTVLDDKDIENSYRQYLKDNAKRDKAFRDNVEAFKKKELENESQNNVEKSVKHMEEITKKTKTKMSEKTPAQAKKYDSCVEDVKAKGGDVNPYAVCQTSVLGNTGDTKKAMEKAWDEYKDSGFYVEDDGKVAEQKTFSPSPKNISQGVDRQAKLASKNKKKEEIKDITADSMGKAWGHYQQKIEKDSGTEAVGNIIGATIRAVEGIADHIHEIGEENDAKAEQNETIDNFVSKLSNRSDMDREKTESKTTDNSIDKAWNDYLKEKSPISGFSYDEVDNMDADEYGKKKAFFDEGASADAALDKQREKTRKAKENRQRLKQKPQ